jgi:hypothetical protein
VIPYDWVSAMVSNNGLCTMVADDRLLPMISNDYGQPMIADNCISASSPARARGGPYPYPVEVQGVGIVRSGRLRLLEPRGTLVPGSRGKS